MRSCSVWYVGFARAAIALSGLAMLAGCGDDEEREKTSCSTTEQTGCNQGFVCEEVEGGEPGCFPPLHVKGRVFDLTSSAAVVGAQIVARDINGASVSRVASSAADGSYDLLVPAKRAPDGKVLELTVTLRADANGFDTFPKAPREALPIELSEASGSPLVLQTAATDIGLIPLADSAGLGWINGKVQASSAGGTLVVAGGSTGVADFNGDFTVFNIPAGEHEVRGYADGLNLQPANVSVTADKGTLGVLLAESGAAGAVVSGKVEIVNGGDGDNTSIILVVEDTFDEAVARGESPRGLRVGDVSGEFSISDVPDGNYVVLAAFENDFLVRDPDTSIGGTEIVHITVSGEDYVVPESFKVTGALGVTSPGAERMEEVSGTPTFVWQDDSSEDTYELRVYDALGEIVWEDLAVPGVSGGGDVSVEYGGPPLKAGMIYQFRVVSIKDGVPISATEDLRGVFLYK